MKSLKYFTVAAILLSLAYCKSTKTTTAAPAPEVAKTEPAKSAFEPSDKQLQVAQARWAGTTAEEISEGQIIYTTKCIKCHMLYDIMEFGEKKWVHEISDMAPKAKLTKEETIKLTKHILSYREANAPVKGN